MMLKVEHVTVRFNDFFAVRNVNFSVKKGEIIGIVGTNGAGKSTLFNALSGTLIPDSGKVFLAELDITKFTDYKRAQQGLLRTFQIPQEFKYLTVEENLRTSRFGNPGENIWKNCFLPKRIRFFFDNTQNMIENVLEQIHLTEVRYEIAGNLSGGQKKLLELGKVLMNKPKVLLLDEPFAGVNPVVIKELSELFVNLSKKGLAIVIIEHNLSALAALVDKMYMMNSGEIISVGEPAEVLADPVVQNAYMGGVL